MSGEDRAAAVDAYLAEHLLPADPVFEDLLRASAEAGLPAADVSPVQGRLLELLARLRGAEAILEIGTLGGYSTLWLARALPPGGRLVTLEVDPHHAEVARANLDRAGVGDAVEIVVGPGAGDPASAARPVRPRLHRRRQGAQRRLPRPGARPRRGRAR